MILTLIVGGRENKGGEFTLDTQNKVILEKHIYIEKPMYIFFPGSTKENYSYYGLEKRMRYFCRREKEDVSLEELLLTINHEGFFFSLNPSLTLIVDKKETPI